MKNSSSARARKKIKHWRSKENGDLRGDEGERWLLNAESRQERPQWGTQRRVRAPCRSLGEKHLWLMECQVQRSLSRSVSEVPQERKAWAELLKSSSRRWAWAELLKSSSRRWGQRRCREPDSVDPCMQFRIYVFLLNETERHWRVLSREITRSRFYF